MLLNVWLRDAETPIVTEVVITDTIAAVKAKLKEEHGLALELIYSGIRIPDDEQIGILVLLKLAQCIERVMNDDVVDEIHVRASGG